MFDIVGLGALNMDNLYRVDRILDDGETVVDEVISTPGGSAANTIYGLARLGVSAGFVGVVGSDAEGKQLVQDFQQVGADTSHIRINPGARTGAVVCLSDQQGKRALYVLPGANNELSGDDIDLAYLSRARMLHISSFVHDQQFQITRELVARLGAATRLSFSPGTLYVTRGLSALAPILKRTYLLFLNHSELRQLTGQDIVAGAATCLSEGCHVVVVTLGKGVALEGMRRRRVTAVAYIKDASSEYVIKPAQPRITPVADTIGAGDAFATGFLFGLLKGKGWATCGQLGDIVAQFSITRAGARPGLPTYHELTQRYYELYHQEL